MKKQHIQLLLSIPLFRDFTDENIEAFLNFNTCKITDYLKDEVILIRGQKVKNIGIVLSGNLLGQIESRDGTVTTINYLEKGSVFGDVLSGSSGNSPVTIIASSKCSILWLELSKLLDIQNNDQNRFIFLQNFIREISDKYFTLHERVQILCERKMRDKITSYFSSLSTKQSSDEIILPQKTKTELANFLGCDRAALTRELNNMEKEGLFSLNKRIVKLLKID
ncbi:MAG: Crp/Fnr family transcriptional regulator [Oscillospiraceae bacterium]|nr:Crp/Fnr family transcriptional regulator [Oscillospiraceae bacterium]